MPEPITVTVTVTVAGTPPSFTYSSSPPAGVSFASPPPKAILEHSGNYAIILELADPGEGHTLVWDTPEILWTHGEPPALGSGFTLPAPTTASQFIIGVQNDNNTTEKKKFGFHLKVIYDGGPLESPDPEIVLDPPSP